MNDPTMTTWEWKAYKDGVYDAVVNNYDHDGDVSKAIMYSEEYDMNSENIDYYMSGFWFGEIIREGFMRELIGDMSSQPPLVYHRDMGEEE